MFAMRYNSTELVYFISTYLHYRVSLSSSRVLPIPVLQKEAVYTSYIVVICQQVRAYLGDSYHKWGRQ